MSKPSFLASPEDGKDILRILESSAAKGNIELLYTRRPDAYASYMKDSADSRVFVSRDKGVTVGTCAELVREVYIDEQPCNAAYVCGLKKDAEYKGSVGFGARFLRELQDDGIDFYYCSVITENSTARKMFEKSHRLLSMKPFCGYKTYIINPKVKVKAPKHSYTFRRATETDSQNLLEFLNTEGRKKDLFPVIKSFEDFHNLKAEDFYLLLDQGKILAAAALWTQTDYKQYVVKRYSRLMKLARIFNPLLSALKYIKLPAENVPLRFPQLAFLLCQKDSTELFRIFLSEITQETAKNNDMFVIGLPDSHFARQVVDKLPAISFTTEIYDIEFPFSNQSYKRPNRENIFIECGLL